MNPGVAGLALSVLCGAAFADEQLQSRKLLEGKVTILVPSAFKLLSDVDKRVKYPGRNAPAYVLSSVDGTVNIAFDVKQLPTKPEDLPKIEAPMRQQFAGAKMNSSGIRKVNGNDLLVFDMDTPAADGTIRNLMVMTSLEGNLLVVSYNCLISRDPGCGALGNQLIGSIVLMPKPAAK